jgi:anti-repressor protein
MRSDKPQARKFRKWVTSEVLPAIRKTGGYGVQRDPMELLNDPVEMRRLLLSYNDKVLAQEG